MHMRVEIEFGSDALDGETVMAVKRQVLTEIAGGIGRKTDDGSTITQGGFQVVLPGITYPIEVRFRSTLFGPGQQPVFS